MNHQQIFDLISAERFRQDELKAMGKFRWTCADRLITPSEKAAILSEECGEVARASLGAMGLVKDGGDLKTELVQVAAVCLAWLETL